MRLGFLKERKHITSFQVIILGFATIILAGALLLMLPFATKDGEGASFLEALFTATSATCVTGLVVQDTATYWTTFGHIVILSLIQIGGMGVVTVAISLTIISGRKIGLMQRSTMQAAISAPKMGGIVRMTAFIFKGVILIEVIGAIALSTVFCRELGIGKGIWYSIFHSISAFCNAGFDLFGFRNKFCSLTDYAANPIVNITIMLLIAIGGIGFFTWNDIRKYKFKFKRYHMQSKVILVVTGMLIASAAAYFFFFEFQDVSMGKRLLASFFHSVSPRTAGFNTMDLTKLTEVGQMVLIILMIIGGSPGSTAGGIKTTTFAVLLGSAAAVFYQRDDTHFFKRRISAETVRGASTIFLMYLVLFLGGGMIISAVEGLPILDCIFETASAIGTVGLSLGITPGLSTISRIVLISLMYFGRVGALTLVFAAIRDIKKTGGKYPEEKITVG